MPSSIDLYRKEGLLYVPNFGTTKAPEAAPPPSRQQKRAQFRKMKKQIDQHLRRSKRNGGSAATQVQQGEPQR